MDMAVACKSRWVRDQAASRVTHGGSRLLNVSVYDDMFNHLLDFNRKITKDANHPFSLNEIKNNQINNAFDSVEMYCFDSSSNAAADSSWTVIAALATNFSNNRTSKGIGLNFNSL